MVHAIFTQHEAQEPFTVESYWIDVVDARWISSVHDMLEI